MLSKSAFARGPVVCATLALTSIACGGDTGGGEGASGLTGEVVIDGSSTVFPISEAAAEEFQAQHPRVRVTVSYSGTGGGFKRFCAGETDISDASRPIKDTEIEACDAAGIEYFEAPVAWDGLSVVVNPGNDFVQCLTVDELRRIWEPGSTVTTWRDVRPEFPDEEISLFGPGTDSGTFDYFTEAIMGESGASRSDYQASEDDNILVTGVTGDPYALGYFGYSYADQNRSRLEILQIDGGDGCVGPNAETVENGTYSPLSRPLFIYVSRTALERPEVAAFYEFYMTEASELVPPTGYVPLAEEAYQENLEMVGGGGMAETGGP